METGISLYDALVSVNVPPDKARSLVQAMEKEMFDKLATKMDLQLLETRLRQDLTLRIGGMLVAGFGLMAGLLKLMH